MSSKISSLVFVGIIPALMIGCASGNRSNQNGDQAAARPAEVSGPVERVDMQTRRLSNRAVDRQSTIVRFADGSADLNDNGRRELRAFIGAARQRGLNIETAHIASWGDGQPRRLFGDNPDESMREQISTEMSEEDQKLADARNQSIAMFLKNELALDDLNMINMAEGQPWFDRRPASAQEAQATGDQPASDAPADISQPALNEIREKGRASVAVIALDVTPAK